MLSVRSGSPPPPPPELRLLYSSGSRLCAGHDEEFVDIRSDKLATALHHANDLLGKGDLPSL